MAGIVILEEEAIVAAQDRRYSSSKHSGSMSAKGVSVG